MWLLLFTKPWTYWICATNVTIKSLTIYIRELTTFHSKQKYFCTYRNYGTLRNNIHSFIASVYECYCFNWWKTYHVVSITWISSIDWYKMRMASIQVYWGGLKLLFIFTDSYLYRNKLRKAFLTSTWEPLSLVVIYIINKSLICNIQHFVWPTHKSGDDFSPVNVDENRRQFLSLRFSRLFSFMSLPTKVMSF